MFFCQKILPGTHSKSLFPPPSLHSFFFSPAFAGFSSFQVEITPLAILISFISHFSSDTHNFQFSNFSAGTRTISTRLCLAPFRTFSPPGLLFRPIVFIEHGKKMHCILHARRIEEEQLEAMDKHGAHLEAIRASSAGVAAKTKWIHMATNNNKEPTPKSEA